MVFRTVEKGEFKELVVELKVKKTTNENRMKLKVSIKRKILNFSDRRKYLHY
jgi:hypothetical protein